MYCVYFDSGTTNTRVYLLDGMRIVAHKSAQIGSRDSALQNDNTILIRELKRLYDSLLSHCGIGEGSVSAIYMSGMISCPSGIVEIEHLSTPVNCQSLRHAITAYYEPRFFARTLYIVPGIKTLPHGVRATLDTVERVNNMRGEEIEIFGILHRCPQLAQGNTIVILPGSHTQAVFLKDGAITDISSNITGELYNALVCETILSSSLTGHCAEPLDGDLVRKGYTNLHVYGFNRALYIVRSMMLFTDATLGQRRSYMEGVLNGGVMDAVVQITGTAQAQIAVAGPHAQYQIYKALAELFPQFIVSEVAQLSDVPFSVEGLWYLLQGSDVQANQRPAASVIG